MSLSKAVLWLAVALIGLTYQRGVGAEATTQPPVVMVRVELKTKGTESAVTVDGKVCAVIDLARELRMLKRDSGRGGIMCEIRMPGQMGYGDLAPVLISAAQADVKRLRLTTDGKDFSEHTLPAIDKVALGTEKGSPPKPKVRGNVTLVRKGEETWISIPAGEPMKMTDEQLSKSLETLAKTLMLEVQIIVQPNRDVPCADVLKVYDQCQRAGFNEVAFAPAGGAEGAGVPATQAESPAPARMKKIVYVVDRSAAMGEQFDGAKKELVRSVNNMIPVVKFDIVWLGEKSTAALGELRRATPDVKKDVTEKVKELKAQGEIAGKLEPFKAAFEKAFSVGPETVYLLTAAGFDPELLKVVEGLNKDHKVRVSAIAYGKADAKRDDLLRQLAKNNGGMFKFISGEEEAK